VLLCPSCLHITGRVGGDGRCDSCQRRAQLEAAYADPQGGWVAVDDTRAPDARRTSGRRLPRDSRRSSAWRQSAGLDADRATHEAVLADQRGVSELLDDGR
jgi:hypothetical protein